MSNPLTRRVRKFLPADSFTLDKISSSPEKTAKKLKNQNSRQSHLNRLKTFPIRDSLTNFSIVNSQGETAPLICGDTLQVKYDIAHPQLPIAVKFAWSVSHKSLSSDSPFYTLTPADIGRRVTVEVTAIQVLDACTHTFVVRNNTLVKRAPIWPKLKQRLKA